jgi:hypothetical protein
MKKVRITTVFGTAPLVVMVVVRKRTRGPGHISHRRFPTAYLAALLLIYVGIPVDP